MHRIWTKTESIRIGTWPQADTSRLCCARRVPDRYGDAGAPRDAAAACFGGIGLCDCDGGISRNLRKIVMLGAAMAGAFLIPLAPWAARNFVTLHEGQILAPRYATFPGEYAPTGFYAWAGTWLERYRDIYSTIWAIGEDPVAIDDLPATAFDSPQEKERISGLLNEYNTSDTLDISPEMDREFSKIAWERTRRHPLRTYIKVPFERALTIWFTPRTELLPIDGKIWPLRDQWRDSHADVLTTAGFAGLGYLYVALAICGVVVSWRVDRTGGAF